MRLGIAHHLGWAVAVTATDDHRVVDRRRIELIEPGLPASPIEHECKPLSDSAAAELVERVRASSVRATSASLRSLADSLSGPVRSISLRSWPLDFPGDIATQRRPPYDSRADSVMYLEVLAEVSQAQGWAVHLYDPRAVEGQATSFLGARAAEVLHGPRSWLGPPWGKDQRVALAATVMAG